MQCSVCNTASAVYDIIGTPGVAICTLACLVVFAAGLTSPMRGQQKTLVRATLVRIIDGDTVVVDFDNGLTNVHIRLLDIDAPETKQGDEGVAATNALH